MVDTTTFASAAAITAEELVQRIKFLEFEEEDVERLTSINDLARRYADLVIDDFYRRLLSFPVRQELAAVLHTALHE